MVLERFHVHGLAHDSIIVGDGNSIAIINPQGDANTYIEYAQSQSLQIVYVLNTCIDSDALSTAANLISRTGATLCLSGYINSEAHCSIARRALHEGDELALGTFVLKVQHNHDSAPENIRLLLIDPSKSSVPIATWSEDSSSFEFNGTPDLLEKEQEQLRRALKRGIQRIQELQYAWNI